MGRFAKIAALAAAVFMANSANAAPPTGTYVGEVAVDHGLLLECGFTVSLNATATSANLALSPGNILCSAIMFTNLPYAVSAIDNGNNGTLTLHDVWLTTITGSCRGDLTIEWYGTILLVDDTLPLVPPVPTDCILFGYAT